MSDEFDAPEDHDEGEGIKNLRKQFEAQKKELAALKAEREQRVAAERAEQVKAALKAAGVPETAAKFYTGEDASPDAVGKWITENADVFRPAVQPQADPNEEAAARVNAASYGEPETPGTAPGGRLIGDPAEIQRAIDTQPYEQLVKMFPSLFPNPKTDPYRRPVRD